MLHFNKSLHFSPQLGIQILGFFDCTDSDYPLPARSSNTPTQRQGETRTAYTTPILWGVYLENDLKYAKLGNYHDRI